MIDSPAWQNVKNALNKQDYCWLVTGAAGFIGSHLVEKLLKLGQRVVGVDNFSTGHVANLDEVKSTVGSSWKNFRLIEGDLSFIEVSTEAVRGVDFVLHQAALGSVPRSIADPLPTHQANVNGMLNMLIASENAKARRFVYASSSSVYGDEASLPKKEVLIGKPLSPYAASKQINEIYAHVFSSCYKLETIGLRYFNVFGPRQDPDGPYAAVIPKWLSAMISETPCTIYGSGGISRDFCYVDNVVQANILGALTQSPESINRVYNVAFGKETTLADLHSMLVGELSKHKGHTPIHSEPTYGHPRPGDIEHSLADISLAQKLLGYQPTHSLAQGMMEYVGWYTHHE